MGKSGKRTATVPTAHIEKITTPTQISSGGESEGMAVAVFSGLATARETVQEEVESSGATPKINVRPPSGEISNVKQLGRKKIQQLNE